ncbi:MAG: M13 family metallopeptidase [Bacteroidia bacterium]
MGQAGVGLGSKDFYYVPSFANKLEKYKEYMSILFKLTGKTKEESDKIAVEVFNFEKALMDKGLSRPEMRDIEKQYNPVTKDSLKIMMSEFDFDSYFKTIGISMPDTIIVSSRTYLIALNDLIKKTDLELLKNYMSWQLLNHSAGYLSADWENAKFDFFGKEFSGAKQQKARWQRVHNVGNAMIGEIISKAYVKKYFPQSSKDKLNKMIDNLILAYRDRIDSRDWMDASTKKQAHAKLDSLIRKIGYPDTWKDYSKMTIGINSYYENVCSASSFRFDENIEKLTKPTDRFEWLMTPITVNAYYNPTSNEITFPAAILQPPFFDPSADDAFNYGCMGAIIGHELTHGFDDQGSQFDSQGNMNNWWTEKDLANFKSRTNSIVKQFDQYVAVDTLHVNGALTQGENIADLGGLTMAYNAYKKSLNGKPSKVIKGFTGEQRFFIAWCQGWKNIASDDEIKRLVTIDPHSPAYFRAWAPLTNLDAFYEAFKIKPNNKLYVAPENRIEIW